MTETHEMGHQQSPRWRAETESRRRERKDQPSHSDLRPAGRLAQPCTTIKQGVRARCNCIKQIKAFEVKDIWLRFRLRCTRVKVNSCKRQLGFELWPQLFGKVTVNQVASYPCGSAGVPSGGNSLCKLWCSLKKKKKEEEEVIRHVTAVCARTYSQGNPCSSHVDHTALKINIFH